MVSACADANAAGSVWDKLVVRYTEPHRAYHNVGHVLALLRHAEACSGHIHNQDLMQFAILFHDAIYDTHARDNEQRSAILAQEALLALRVKGELVEPVKQCILATRNHQVPEDCALDLPLFLDIDLAILGGSEDDYQEYSQLIRQEYGWVADDAYQYGRSAVLKAFLERPCLFFTPAMAAFEAQARSNLARELASLVPGSVGR